MLLGIMRGGDVLFLDGCGELGVFGLDGFPEVGEFLGDGDFGLGAVAVVVAVIVTGEAERREGEGGDGCE